MIWPRALSQIPFLQAQCVLEANFDRTDNPALPYDVFDALRTRHSINLTGFKMSMASHGIIYMSYDLVRGA